MNGKQERTRIAECGMGNEKKSENLLRLKVMIDDGLL